MPTSPQKSFDIPKQLVWEAYRAVAEKKGAPGVDEVSLGEFESNLENNLYKIWNRMSSGSYFPPPVRAVEIPKPHGGGTRMLGVPTVADRVAQTTAAMVLVEAVTPASIPTPTATVRSFPPTMRWPHAGSGAGSSTGSSTSMSRSSSTPCPGTSS
jgi:hypothetical protein